MTQSSPRKGIIINDRIAEEITRSEELAYELKISEVMAPNVLTITPDTKMSEVVECFRKARISGAPVIEGDKIVGVISMEDLIQCLCQSDLAAPTSKYMTANPITVRASDPVIEALKVFVSSKKGRLIVVDEQNHLAGILTKGDITRGLLKALQKDYQVEELRTYRASHLFQDIVSDRTSLILRYNIKPRDFNHGGSASSAIKRALLRLGAKPQIARRVGIAVYEAEMNQIIHTINGGGLRVEIEPHRISIVAHDKGPGIKDVELAMKPGYSTATEEIRELGFGAGMGLVNIYRCADTMILESEVGRGTRLQMKIYLNEETVGERQTGKEEAKEK